MGATPRLTPGSLAWPWSWGRGQEAFCPYWAGVLSGSSPPPFTLGWSSALALMPDRAFTCALLLPRRSSHCSSRQVLTSYLCSHVSLERPPPLTHFPPFNFYKSSTPGLQPFALPVYFLYSPKHCLKFKYLFIYWFLAVPHSLCGISLPNQEPEPCPLHWKNGVVTTGWPGKCQHCLDSWAREALLSQGRCLLKQMEQMEQLQKNADWSGAAQFTPPSSAIY